MARKKDPDGVQATIERLTGKSPCPEYLRSALNKYLNVPGLFPKASTTEKRDSGKREGELRTPNTDNLVLNVLALDEVFRGQRKVVASIIKGEISPENLKQKLDCAARDMRRRFEIYANWVNRIPSLDQLLTSEEIDLKTCSIREKLEDPNNRNPSNRTPPFALRAVQQLEQIEERGGLGIPSPKECVERADALFALGDHAAADAYARKALEQDETYPKAWFIRVMIALSLRKHAVKTGLYHNMAAQEIADLTSVVKCGRHESHHAECCVL